MSDAMRAYWHQQAIRREREERTRANAAESKVGELLGVVAYLTRRAEAAEAKLSTVRDDAELATVEWSAGAARHWQGRAEKVVDERDEYREAWQGAEAAVVDEREMRKQAESRAEVVDRAVAELRHNLTQERCELKEITELAGGTWFSAAHTTELVRNLANDLKEAQKLIASQDRYAKELGALEAHGVDNWEGYGDAMRCAENGGCETCG